jgi:FolB domain-containing protein
MATIHITDLHLRTIIGINDWERDKKQDVYLNIALQFDGAKASHSDKIQDTIDYKKLTKRIIAKVESSKYFLLEKLAAQVLNLIFEDKKVEAATVRIDKPMALRFAKSVSVTLTKCRDE